MTLDIEKIRADVKRMGKEREQADNERGFCMMPFPRQKDPFLLELLERTEAKIRPFLIKYAKVVYDTGEIVEVDSDRLNNMRDDLRIISYAKEMQVSSKATYYMFAIDFIVQHKKRGLTALGLARRLTELLEDTEQPARLYSREVPPEDYEYNFDEEYKKAREVQKCRDKICRS